MSEWSQPICEEIWRSKYRYGAEETFEDTCRRVVNGVYANDLKATIAKAAAVTAMISRRWMPAGRIFAGAGTDKHVTLINCFVSPTIRDAISTRDDEGENDSIGIFDALTVAAMTQQMGGGIGMDFSPIRPKGSPLKRTGEGAVASGPVSFMRVWNTMCETMMSAGSRRGAMMATLRIDHPDIYDFVNAKNTPGELTNFNVSVLVTDMFMAAVEVDGEFALVHRARPSGGSSAVPLDDGQFVHRLIKARDLWDKIMRNTYDHAEPGVIFIDRVNQWNNLKYCETISCTNPCGEQPLPPNGDCNLGHVNLAAHVENGHIRWDLLRDTVDVGVRFLDNVIDVTRFPTPAQAAQAMHKRRIGLGVTGLANMLQLMGQRYGSREAIKTTKEVMNFIARQAYYRSAALAKERGPFPAYDCEKFMESRFVRKLIQDSSMIASYGIRNGVLLTCAPTGTTSIMYGNVSSGIEPTFAWKYTRKVRQADGSFKPQEVYDWGWLEYCRQVGVPPTEAFDSVRTSLLDYMVTAQDLTINDHLKMQAACQEWVDASISKTINVPTDTHFDTFKGVYATAYSLGLKGVTTYRPNQESGRGSILEVGTKVEINESKHKDTELAMALTGADQSGKEVKETIVIRDAWHTSEKRPRPEVLHGLTRKVRWPEAEASHYLTLNFTDDKQPFELFIASKDTQHAEWIQALTLLITSIFRRGGDTTFWIKELKEVRAVNGGLWVPDGEKQRFIPSLVAFLAEKIEELLHPTLINIETDVLTSGETMQQYVDTELKRVVEKVDQMPGYTPNYMSVHQGRQCPKCQMHSLFRESGCDLCKNCDYSKCG